MTTLIITSILTIIIALGLDVNLMLDVIKKFADDGYKIKPSSEKGDKELNPLVILAIFTPFINILLALYFTLALKMSSTRLINSITSSMTIEYMNKMEQKIYNKNPSKLNALVFQFIAEEKLKTAKTITFNDDKSYITYGQDSKTEEIEIYDQSYDLAAFQEHHLINMIKDQIIENEEKIIELTKDIEMLQKELIRRRGERKK